MRTIVTTTPNSADTIRPANQDDVELLWEFLTIAAYEPNVEVARAQPVVATHLEGWLRPNDFGFVAERDGRAIGGAWARQFSPSDEPTFYVDDRTPEISIGIQEGARGQGVGQALLRALIAEAARRVLGLCLNVRDSNRALRLYERVGFEIAPDSAVPNRVGGLSIGMILRTR
jgi:GNAT superfamily N-acetyltransferase